MSKIKSNIKKNQVFKTINKLLSSYCFLFYIFFSFLITFMFTNSTDNRLKFSKGWKNSNFPETLPFYSRDNVFFFKLYLILQTYFTLKRTHLIYCDIRQAQNSKKLLYLVINSIPRKFRKKQSNSTWFLRKPHTAYKKIKRYVTALIAVLVNINV